MVVVNKSIRRIRIEISIVAVIVAFTIVLLNNFVKLPFPIFAGSLGAVAVLWVAGWFISDWYAKTFILELREDDVRYTKGVIARKQITIPLEKIINLRVDERGLLDRILGECTISIDSAGTSEVEIVITEVLREKAEEFNQELMLKMKNIGKEMKKKGKKVDEA
ncbi:MAG: PH domain-containing protein [Candidatus Anstonellales archaeon]